jgi:hypothetical protein
MDMTKRAVKAALNIKTDADLARFFNIGRAAVGFWNEDAPIPDARIWELRARMPELFAIRDEAA